MACTESETSDRTSSPKLDGKKLKWIYNAVTQEESATASVPICALDAGRWVATLIHHKYGIELAANSVGADYWRSLESRRKSRYTRQSSVMTR